MNVYAELELIFQSAEAANYLGEDVTMAEHMLQCAAFAQSENASGELIITSLTHDMGHLHTSDADELQNSGTDAHHDDVGANWLAERFGLGVSQPVRLHVAAKRYLVTTNPNYLKRLLDASMYTLQLQGGEINAEKGSQFSLNPHASAAIAVRLWDDRAKTVGLALPGLSAYQQNIEMLQGEQVRCA
jgi:gamma-butyrobetaine dioxygenase